MESVGEFEYNTKDLIGHGAFAVVFKGRHKTKTDLVVAIKNITKKNLSKSQNLLGKEIKILRELAELHHENVVALLDCKETAHHVYLVMEYCNGGDLADYLHVKGTLSEDTIQFFLRQIAGAMKALNGKGIVHRDLKPQNILLCHSGKPNPPPSDITLKIADFGFARFLQDGVMAATLCGSPMYMAPEVIMSLQYDAKADLWSIGTIVFQCLTGKAPFQAQTPQALKQFYEKNANLLPRIPPGTSSNLNDLLIRLLKRNARDRMEFDEFFNHPFLKTVTRETSPVPVPSRHSLSPTSPRTPQYGSPLSGNLAPSPLGWDKEMGGEEMAQEPISVSREVKQTSSPDEQDFVMVPESLPIDRSYNKVNSPGKWQQSDINRTLTMANTPPKCTADIEMQSNNDFTIQEHNKNSPECTRSNSLPMISPIGSPTQPRSEPIPVPSQKEAYQQIQRSLQDSSSSSQKSNEKSHSIMDVLPSPTSSPITPKLPFSQRESPSSQPIDNSIKITDISSLSPPSVQFTTGTLPLGTRRRSLSGESPPLATWRPSISLRQSITPPPTSLSVSPIRRSGTIVPPVSNYLSTTGHGNPLSPILASPAREISTVESKTLDVANRMSPVSTKEIEHYKNVNLVSSIHASYGNKTMTIPDLNSKDIFQGNTRESLEYSNNSIQRSGSAGKLIDQIHWRGSHIVGVPPSPPTSMMPYSHHHIHHHQCHISGPLSPHNSPGRTRRSSISSGRLFTDSSSPTGPGFMYFGTSPPNMEGPILFTAPDLPEETLLQREHNETLAKLNFILALVDCILELAKSKSNPITALTESYNETNIEQISLVSEGYRRAEQLVLYMRALQLLSSSLQLSRQEVQAGNLQPSSTVRTVLRTMKEHFHYCLSMCKLLNTSGILHSTGVDPNSSAITADRLLYNYAIDMCQSAALEELFGNPEECFRRYQTAQILLHSLSQQINREEDRKLLIKYKDAVEKRLFVLHSQGYVIAYDSN
ncbi:serine/threonine-protein kinase unc-51-like isoform X2 [Centruroides vittatus]|uniref:serine/threonine-protein kinase unc-51-like isoform X2 n=1 Tax=Centruroides vittatus TaxID=120091 RepID=UPI00351051D4